MNVFNDLSKANNEVRLFNIDLLKSNGFIEGGLKSTSGGMYIIELKTKSTIVFGMRCNVAGKRNKYFSLSKDFENKDIATRYFNNLKPSLKVQ